MTRHAPVQPISNTLNKQMVTNLGLLANATKLATEMQHERSFHASKVLTPTNRSKNTVNYVDSSKMADTLSQRTRGILGNETPQGLTTGDIQPLLTSKNQFSSSLQRQVIEQLLDAKTRLKNNNLAQQELRTGNPK